MIYKQKSFQFCHKDYACYINMVLIYKNKNIIKSTCHCHLFNPASEN